MVAWQISGQPRSAVDVHCLILYDKAYRKLTTAHYPLSTALSSYK